MIGGDSTDKEKLKALHNNLYLKYKWNFTLEFADTDGFYSYIISKRIIIPRSVKTHQTEWSLFAFLHEIGHIMTNTPEMKRCTQEYLATQWALDEAKRIGFNVPKSYIKTYQDYIWGWRNRAIKLKAKVVPAEDELRLVI